MMANLTKINQAMKQLEAEKEERLKQEILNDAIGWKEENNVNKRRTI
jgi:hypothetical protein